MTGEKTVAELSRELDIAPSVIRSWKRFAEAGAATAVQASEDVVPASQLREAYTKIRDLERALGRKTMEVEILRTTQEIVKKRRRCAEGPGGHLAPPRRRRAPVRPRPRRAPPSPELILASAVAAVGPGPRGVCCADLAGRRRWCASIGCRPTGRAFLRPQGGC